MSSPRSCGCRRRTLWHDHYAVLVRNDPRTGRERHAAERYRHIDLTAAGHRPAPRMRTQRLYADLHGVDFRDVPQDAVDHDARPAVAQHLTRHCIAEHRAIERAAVVDDENAAFAGLPDELSDQA